MGIPEIRLHPTDLDREEVAEQAKGWLLFVRSVSQRNRRASGAHRSIMNRTLSVFPQQSWLAFFFF